MNMTGTFRAPLKLLIIIYMLATNVRSTRRKSCASSEFCITLKECPHLLNKLKKLRALDQRKDFRKHICKFMNGEIFVCCSRLPRKCGSLSAYNKIIGGKAVRPGSLPWMAALRYKRPGFSNEVFHCAGSVINSRYILTAAHCLDILGSGTELRAIHLGETHLKLNPECANDVCYNNIVAGYEKIIVHQGFSRDTFRNDIALIRLNVSIDFNTKDVRVAPICLPTRRFNLKNSAKRRRFTVAGWGSTENSTESDILLATTLSLAEDSRCGEMFGSRFDSEGESQICAGGRIGKDTCLGDSGGPLILNGPNGWPFLQLGIVSYGTNPCGTEIPAVYTSVFNFRPWILRQLEP